MERMRGIDAGYLYMETPSVHMHTLKVGVLDTSSVSGGYSYERFHSELATRLHLLPPFRRRIVAVPFALHHPLWVEDPGFRLDRHLERVVLPSPGSMAQLDELVGEVAGRPLPRDRPLWSITVVEGIQGGGFAIIAKVHHSVADGVASAALLANVMDTAAAPQDPGEPPVWRPDRVPGPVRLVVDALRDRLADLADLPSLLRDTARRLLAVGAHRRRTDVPPPRPLLDAPRAGFTGAPDARREFCSVPLSFDDFRAVRGATGATINDVVMAVVDGALRQWMLALGDPPRRPLLAAVPVSADADGGLRLSGNRVSSLLTSLATDEPDPLERLRRISAVSASAKVVQSTLGVDMLERWVQFTPPFLFAPFMRLYSRLRLADRHAPAVNIVISNVPGPREPLFIAGAELTDFFSVGPVLEGIPINVTAWSYRGRLSFAVLASPRTCPRLRVLADGLAHSLRELLAASGAGESSGTRPAQAG